MIIPRQKEFSDKLSKFRSKYKIDYDKEDDNENSLRKEMYEKSGKIPLRAFKRNKNISYPGNTEVSRAEWQEYKDHSKGKSSKSNEDIVSSAEKHAKKHGRIVGGSIGSIAGAGAGMLLSKGKKPNLKNAGVGAAIGGISLGSITGKKFKKSAKKDVEELLDRRDAATKEYKEIKNK